MGLSIPGPNLCVGSYDFGRKHARADEGGIVAAEPVFFELSGEDAG